MQQAQNLADLIENNSGIYIKSYGASSLSSISFRGTGASHTQVLWNGVPLNSPMNGQIDFSLYPTLFFDQAELHHGASGIINGDGALGGSVVLNNSEKFNNKTTTSFSQSIGSFGNYISAFKLKTGNKRWFYETQLYGHKAENNFTYTNITLRDNPEEQMENSNVNQYGIQQAIYRKLKNSTIGLRCWYFNSDRKLPAIISSEALNDESQKDESYRALLEWKGLKNNFQYHISSALVKDLLVYENKISNIYSKSYSYLFDNKINISYYLNHKFKIINNLDFKYEMASSDGYSEQHKRLNSSWLLGINKTFNRITIDVFNRTMLVGETFKNLAPGIGTQIKLLNKEDLFFKANAGINYHYPTFNDLYWNPGGNEDLKPEYAKMLESGLSFSKPIRKTTIKTGVTAFYSYVYDWIIWLPTDLGYWSPMNLKEVKNKGIETELNLTVHINKLKIIGNLNYAYTQSTNMKADNDHDNSLNKQLIYVPYHKLSNSIQLHYKKMILAYTYNYTSERFITSDNNWYLPANFISSVSISNRFVVHPTWNVSGTFKVTNILGQEYQSIANRPMPGRNYLLSIIVNFNKG